MCHVSTTTSGAVGTGKIDALIASGRVRSIVIDSITFYCELYLNGLVTAPGKYDPRRVYGDLGNHLRDFRTKTHAKHTNVAWLALAREPEQAQVDKDGNLISPAIPGGPLIPGKSSDTFAAAVQLLWYFQKTYPAGEKKPPAYLIHTQPYGKYPAGNRLGALSDKLPNPLIGNYSDYLTLMGYDPETIRRNLPAINGAKVIPVSTVPPKPTVAKGPVIIRKGSVGA